MARQDGRRAPRRLAWPAFLVCGRDGLDEVTLAAPTMVREVLHNRVISHEWIAADFGLEPCSLEDLQVNTVEETPR